MSNATIGLLLAGLLSYLLGSGITWYIMRRKIKEMEYVRGQLWLGQKKIWDQYQELLRERRTQP